MLTILTIGSWISPRVHGEGKIVRMCEMVANNRRKKRKMILRVIFVLLILSVASAKDKAPKVYPEHGTVIAVRTGEYSRNVPVRTDSSGKTWGGYSARRKTQTYRIETETLVYEIMEREKNPRLAVGDGIDFRIEKQRAYLREGDKERKYDLMATEQKR